MMNNSSTSNFSSGCESGWTTYLDQFSDSAHHEDSLYSNYYVSQNHNNNNYSYHGGKEEDCDEELGEDLSMVSDASSGPPHDLNYYHLCNYSASEERNKSTSNYTREEQQKQKVVKKQQQKKKHYKNLCLDDTASSSVFQLREDDQANATGFSQDFSAGDIEADSTEKKRFGFFKSVAKGKGGSFLGRKRQ